jgi:hypothetical protein
MDSFIELGIFLLPDETTFSEDIPKKIFNLLGKTHYKESSDHFLFYYKTKFSFTSSCLESGHFYKRNGLEVCEWFHQFVILRNGEEKDFLETNSVSDLDFNGEDYQFASRECWLRYEKPNGDVGNSKISQLITDLNETLIGVEIMDDIRLENLNAISFYSRY